MRGGLMRDLRQALRSLRATPGFVAVAVLTLAIGIGSVGAIYSVVAGTLLEPLPYPQAERIVRIHRENRDTPAFGGPVSKPLLEAWRDGSGETFTALGAFAGTTAHFRAGDAPAESLAAYRVTPDFWDVMALAPQAGRYFGEVEETSGEAVVVLGHDFWQTRFGGRDDIVGRDVLLNGVAHRVVGVTTAAFRYPGQADVYVPTHLPVAGADADSSYLSVIARLAPGVDATQAHAALDLVDARLREADAARYDGLDARLTPLGGLLVGDVRQPLLVLLGASALVLLIACVNLANLLLARGAARRRELAVRAALGAGKARLLRLVLAESVLIGLVGGGLGLLGAALAVPLLLTGAPDLLPSHARVGVDAGVVTVSLAVALTTLLLFSLAPALRAAGVAPAGAMNAEGRDGSGGRERSRLRGLLVAGEIALALVLLAGAGLLIESLRQVGRAETGVEADGVLTASFVIPTAHDPFAGDFTEGYKRHSTLLATRLDAVIARVAAIPGVQAVALSDALPLSGIDNVSSAIQIVGASGPAAEAGANWRFVNPDFARALGIGVVAGRSIEAADARPGEFPTTVLVNQTFARRFLPEGDPVGRQITFLGGPKTIVGVLADTRTLGYEHAPVPEVYLHHAQAIQTQFSLALRAAGDPRALAEPLRRALAEVDPAMPVFGLRTLAEMGAAGLAMRAFNLRLMVAFSAIALLLAAIGIYGVIANAVGQRRREFGLRQAVGARRGDIHRLVLGSGLRLIVPGVLAGVLGALALGRLLASQLYGVGSADPAVLAAVVAVLSAVALAACLIPAHRAARIAPMEALRHD